MPDKINNPVTPAGTPAQIDLQALTEAASNAAIKAVTEALPGIVDVAMKPMGDQLQTLTASLANVPTVESVTKAVSDAVAEQTSAQDNVTARQTFINENLKGIPDAFHSHIGEDPAKWEGEATTLRTALKGAGAPGTSGGEVDPRQVVIDKIVAEKFGGNAELSNLLTGSTDEDLNTQADNIVTQFKKNNPDFGGAASAGTDGGDTPNEEQPGGGINTLQGVTPGVAGYAKSIKMPGTPGSTAAPAASVQDAAGSAGDTKTDTDTDAK